MKYTRPGEYFIKSIRLISDNELNHNIEISSLVIELNIYENMFQCRFIDQSFYLEFSN